MPKRTSTGCWTCKIRKKKCDEAGPPCNRCIKSKFECYGYDKKPDWLIGKSSACLRKYGGASTSSRKSSHDSSSPIGVNASTSTDDDQLLDHKPLALPTANRDAQLLLNYLANVFPIQWKFYHGSNQFLLPLLSQSRALFHCALSISALHMASIDQNHSAEHFQVHHEITLKELRSSLLLHSNVFPDCTNNDQYSTTGSFNNANTNNTIDNMNTSTSTSTSSSTSNSNSTSTNNDNIHAPVAPVGIQGPMSPSPDNVQITHSLAVVVMLISFELFKGGTENWKHHIAAGIALVSVITNDGLLPIQPSSCSFAQKFLISSILWMDLLSCATTEMPCQMSPYLQSLTSHSPSTLLPLEQLMGCSLFVLLQLNEVMVLHNWNRTKLLSFSAITSATDGSDEMSRHHHLFLTRANNIRSRLAPFLSTSEEYDPLIDDLYFSTGGPIGGHETDDAGVGVGIGAGMGAGMGADAGIDVGLMHSFTHPAIKARLIHLTTKLFAIAISIYLHGIVLGFCPTTYEIANDVDSAVAVINAIPAEYYRSLVFPLCVVGSMAQPHQYHYFTQLFDQKIGHDFGNSNETRRIIEKTWEIRDQLGPSNPNVYWITAMQHLGSFVLLV